MFKRKWMRFIAPPASLLGGFVLMMLIGSTGADDGDAKEVDIRPTVVASTFPEMDYTTLITSFGEVEPTERTNLSAQVSGEVVFWHEQLVPGGLVKRGEVLIKIEKDSYEAAVLQAEASVAQAEAALIEERALAAVAEREARNISDTKVSDLYLRKPQLLSAKAALKSAKASLKIAQRDLENCVVRAPYDALVVSRSFGKGQFVTQGQGIAELNNIEYAEIMFPIAGFDTGFLPAQLEGINVRVSSAQLAQVEREGKIVRDAGVIDTATRMTHFVARVSDPYALNSDLSPLKFGSYVELSFAGKTLERVYKLPQELINNRIVWVLDSDHKLEPRSVTVLREEGEYFLVSEGLSAIDRVITTLPNYPRKGMEVKLPAISTESGAEVSKANTEQKNGLSDLNQS